MTRHFMTHVLTAVRMILFQGILMVIRIPGSPENLWTFLGRQVRMMILTALRSPEQDRHRPAGVIRLENPSGALLPGVFSQTI